MKGKEEVRALHKLQICARDQPGLTGSSEFLAEAPTSGYFFKPHYTKSYKNSSSCLVVVGLSHVIF